MIDFWDNIGVLDINLSVWEFHRLFQVNLILNGKLGYDITINWDIFEDVMYFWD